MKKLAVLSFLFILAYLCAPFSASADPRMETNGNFCHFIFDPLDTDNEIFLAGCNAIIAVMTGSVAKMVSDEQKSNGEPQVQCSEYVASGYGTATRVVPLAASTLPVGTTLKFTSEDSETPCTIVESNGRQYISYNWESKIRVVSGTTSGTVKIVYQLTCRDGKM